MRVTRSRDEGGATAVEFALISIPFLVLVLGMIQYGWYFYVSQTTGGAASNVVRELQVGDCWASGAALARAKNQSPMVTGVDKLPNQATPPTPGTDITVTVRANGSIIGFVPMPNGGAIEKVVQARAEDDTVGTCG